MIKIKISSTFPNWPLFRQTRKSAGIWDDCVFYLNEDNAMEYDYWIIYDDLIHMEEAICSKANIILITSEPPSIKQYSKEFIRQFSTIITCNRNIKHDNVIYEQQALPWHIGRCQTNHKNIIFTKEYDYLKIVELNNNRRMLSVIISNKALTKGHKKRIKFVEFLSNQNDIQLDIFGRGFKEVSDKWDAIYNYKYHLVLENCVIDDYWTEKLADSYLGGAFPLYSGAPNISKYFDSRSLTQIDIKDYYKSKDQILSTISNNTYEKSYPLLMAQRNRILDKYNIFPFVVNYISKTNTNIRNKEKIILQPDKELQSKIEKVKVKLLRYINKYK